MLLSHTSKAGSGALVSHNGSHSAMNRVVGGLATSRRVFFTHAAAAATKSNPLAKTSNGLAFILRSGKRSSPPEPNTNSTQTPPQDPLLSFPVRCHSISSTLSNTLPPHICNHVCSVSKFACRLDGPVSALPALAARPGTRQTASVLMLVSSIQDSPEHPSKCRAHIVARSAAWRVQH